MNKKTRAYLLAGAAVALAVWVGLDNDGALDFRHLLLVAIAAAGLLNSHKRETVEHYRHRFYCTTCTLHGSSSDGALVEEIVRNHEVNTGHAVGAWDSAA